MLKKKSVFFHHLPWHANLKWKLDKVNRTTVLNKWTQQRETQGNQQPFNTASLNVFITENTILIEVSNGHGAVEETISLLIHTKHTNRFKNRHVCSLVNTSMHVILYMYFMHFFRHIQYLYCCPAQYFSEKSFLSITWLWQQLHLKVMFLLFQDTENGFFMNVNDQVLCNFYSLFLVPAHSVATFIEWCINCQNFLNKRFIQCFTQKLVLLSFYLKWLFASFCIYGAIRICILLKYCSRIDFCLS